MCGLAGALLARPDGLSDAILHQRGAAMATRLAHRGPDDDGCWTGRGVVLAHRRLAVIDTSDAAAQPMHDASGDVHLIFNGAIYNFRALRRELEAAGHRFRGTGDTEVIAEGYRAWGTDLFRRLTGMFAIAIWDSRTERLVLARDRFGEKPLYYQQGPDALLFGSEAKAILSWPNARRRPNFAALHDFLSFSYTLGEDTAFDGIKRVPPAHFVVCERGKAPVFHRYWRLPEPGAARLTLGTEDIKHELIARVRHAVELCLVTDVPLGAFLSGGVDSSAVVAMMAGSPERADSGSIRTFSAGFGFGDYDETRFARMVADRYGTQHSEFTYDNRLIGHMADLAWHYGEPFADSSALVAYALSREVRQDVTVALTGDGADENLLGYARYFRFGGMLRQTPPDGRRRLPALYAAVPQDLDPRRPAADAYGRLVETFREWGKLSGYGAAMLPHLDDCSYDRLMPHVAAGLTPEEQAGRIDVSTYLADDLLVKMDVAAMAHGLETRAPFLNHELVEWIWSIPAEQKIWNSEGKALLKAALEPYVPRDCLYRTKMGFRVPVAKMMREEISDITRDVLLGERFLDRQILRRGYVEEMLAEHGTQRQEHGTRLWALLSLEMWFRTWIDSDSSERLSPADDPFAAFAQAA